MVNFQGFDINEEDIIALLKRDLKYNEVCRRYLALNIIREEAHKQNIEVSDEEIQAESESIRRELRLESAEKTLAWLREQQLSAETWQESIRDRLLTQKLADTLFHDTAKTQFEQNKLDYEQVALYRLIVPNIQTAQEIIYQIEENETTFFEAAHLYDIDAERRAYCGYEGQLSRWVMDPNISASVFGANAQEVVGPFTLKEGQALFFVDRFIKPELTDEIYQQIRDRKFQQWLDRELQRRQPSVIEA